MGTGNTSLVTRYLTSSDRATADISSQGRIALQDMGSYGSKQLLREGVLGDDVIGDHDLRGDVIGAPIRIPYI